MTYAVDVLPRTFNCSQQDNIDLCIALPGCIHCLYQENALRVLEDASSESDKVNSYNYYYETRRHLYPKILPDFAGIDDLEADEGYCVDGFGNSACPLDSSKACHLYYSYLSFGFLVVVLLVDMFYT